MTMRSTSMFFASTGFAIVGPHRVPAPLPLVHPSASARRACSLRRGRSRLAGRSRSCSWFCAKRGLWEFAPIDREDEFRNVIAALVASDEIREAPGWGRRRGVGPPRDFRFFGPEDLHGVAENDYVPRHGAPAVIVMRAPDRHGNPKWGSAVSFVISAAMFASGAAALIFETLWFRQTGLVVGNGVWASSLALAAFMAGLALGQPLRSLAMARTSGIRSDSTRASKSPSPSRGSRSSGRFRSSRVDWHLCGVCSRTSRSSPTRCGC